VTSNYVLQFCAVAVSAACFAMTLAFASAGRAQTAEALPSPWFDGERIRFFPAGAAFKLSREAADRKAYRAEVEAEWAGRQR